MKPNNIHALFLPQPLRSPFGQYVLRLGLILLALLGSTAASMRAASLPFFDNFENGLSQWTTNGGWGLTAARANSPTRSVTDSPGSFYANDTDATLTLGTSLDLSSATQPVVSFHHQHLLEPDYDFGYVEVSSDGGNSWNATPLAGYTGSSTAMSREQLDLSAWAGQSDVRIRFRLVTDFSVVMDGWYVDDVRVAEAPVAVTLEAPVAVTPNSVQLSWSESAEAGFAAYRIYRSQSPALDWHTAQVVAQISERSTTTATDITVGPKSRYYYRVNGAQHG